MDCWKLKKKKKHYGIVETRIEKCTVVANGAREVGSFSLSPRPLNALNLIYIFINVYLRLWLVE